MPGAVDLLAQARPDLRDQLTVFRRLLQRMMMCAGAKRHLHERLHLPRLCSHDQDPIAKEHRLIDGVGDEDNCFLVLLPDAQQLLLEEELVLRIERRERLVHQQDFRIVGEGARYSDALAHAAGELVRVIIGETCQPGAREVMPDDLFDRGGGHAAHLQTVGRIVPHRHPGKMESPWKIIEFTGRLEVGVSISITPAVTDSSPARMRSRVVLPHPLGPTIMKNSPCAISTETPSMAINPPKSL
jgi:hypothetical protein